MEETNRTELRLATVPEVLSPQMWALNPMVSMVSMAGWSEIANESGQFVSKRLKKMVQVQHDTFKCNSLEELLHVQSSYLQDALEQYNSHYHFIAKLLSKTTALGWSEATHPRSRNYDDIPL